MTVLIPMHNAAGYVTDAVQSVLAEPIADLEVLVIDDGSTDASVAELRAIGDDRVRIVQQPQSGVVAALNRGLDLARDQLVVRMDADDISVPGRIAAQVRWMQARPDAVMCGTAYEMFGALHGRVRMPVTDSACRQRLLLSSSHCGASIMLRRRVLDEHRVRYDPSLTCAEDYELITRVACLGEIGNVPMVGYRYRIHQTQASNRRREPMRGVHLAVAARHAQRTGMRALSDGALRSLLWPDADGVLRVAWVSGRVAARAILRRPGIETVRFCTRTAVENVLEARRRPSRDD